MNTSDYTAAGNKKGRGSKHKDTAFFYKTAFKKTIFKSMFDL